MLLVRHLLQHVLGFLALAALECAQLIVIVSHGIAFIAFIALCKHYTGSFYITFL
jgi:hypothetical protein